METISAAAPSPHLLGNTLSRQAEVTLSYFLHYFWAIWEGDESCSSHCSPLDFTPVQAAHCHLSLPYRSASPLPCVPTCSPAASSACPQFLPSCAHAVRGQTSSFPFRCPWSDPLCAGVLSPLIVGATNELQLVQALSVVMYEGA